MTGPVSKEDRAAVKQFYVARGFKPAWVVNGQLTDGARAMIAKLRTADIDGLNPDDFPTPFPMVGTNVAARAGILAGADIELSELIATYVHQAQVGKVNPQSIAQDVGFEPKAVDGLGALNYLTIAKDAAAALVAYNPPQEGYARLRDALATARKEATERKVPEIPTGPTLKPGMSDPRVVVLRERLEVTAPAGSDPALYDETLVDMVKAFQKDAGLKPDGMIGGGTVAKLNQGVADPTKIIISNMERWRWLPRDLGRFYVNVNIPQFELAVHRNGEIAYTTRIVVGKPTEQDADLLRRDRARHCQSVLERARLDHHQGNAAADHGGPEFADAAELRGLRQRRRPLP